MRLSGVSPSATPSPPIAPTHSEHPDIHSQLTERRLPAAKCVHKTMKISGQHLDTALDFGAVPECDGGPSPVLAAEPSTESTRLASVAVASAKRYFNYSSLVSGLGGSRRGERGTQGSWNRRWPTKYRGSRNRLPCSRNRVTTLNRRRVARRSIQARGAPVSRRIPAVFSMTAGLRI